MIISQRSGFSLTSCAGLAGAAQACALCLLVAAAQMGWAQMGWAQGVPQAEGGPSAPLPVRAVTAHLAPVMHHHEISGEIAAETSFTVAFRDGGRLEVMAVEAGDHVVPGQVLARIDPVQGDAAVAAATAGLEAAEAALRQARLARDRAQALADRGAGTRADLDAATQALLSARATRDQAQVRLDKALQSQRDTVIRADARAIVTQRLAQQGQIVGPAQPVLRLARDGAREAVFYVPDTVDLAQMEGDRVQVRTLDGPVRTFGAVISEIAPLVLEGSGTVRVTARLEETALPPALGAAVAGRMDWESDAVISLPASAIAVTQHGPAVWRMDPQTQRVSLKQVTVVRHEAEWVEIEAAGGASGGGEAGIEAGDVIVTDGSQLLYPDRLIHVVEESR